MKLPLDSSSEEIRIEIIPLIDVIFCILTFFILAALQLTRQQAINVDIPRANTGIQQMREMLIVSVDTIGQTYIEQQPVTREQLLQQLLVYRQQNPTGLVALYAPKTAVYDDVVQVLDLLRSVGGDRVALATLPESSSSPSPSVPGLAPIPPGGNLGSPSGTPSPLSPLNPAPLNPAPLNPGQFPLSPSPQIPGGATPGLSPTTPPGNFAPGAPAPGTGLPPAGN